MFEVRIIKPEIENFFPGLVKKVLVGFTFKRFDQNILLQVYYIFLFRVIRKLNVTFVTLPFCIILSEFNVLMK